MENFILYAKSYGPDVHQCKRCFESIKKYNVDNIPFYISVPKNDFKLFKDILGTEGYTLLADEDIYQFTVPLTGWRNQQIIKTHINRLNICKNYLCLDSDSFFIKDFRKSDFMANDDVVFTLMQDPMDIKMVTHNVKDRDFYKTDFFRTCRDVRSVFGNTNFKKWYLFGPPPYPWNCSVWEAIQNWLKDNNMTMDQFFAWFEQTTGAISRETVLYGEFLLLTQMIDIFPTSNWFKQYSSKELYEYDSKCGVDFDFVKKYYLGVAPQDGRSTREQGITWNSEMTDKIIKDLKW